MTPPGARPPEHPGGSPDVTGTACGAGRAGSGPTSPRPTDSGPAASGPTESSGTDSSGAGRGGKESGGAGRGGTGVRRAGAGRAGTGRVPRSRDRGSATVWAAITAGTLLVVALVGVDLASAVRARHVAESAADLAALTAAGHATDGPEQACAAARVVAVANGAALRECGLDGWDATVRVEVARGWTLVGRGPAGATARAGPAEPETDPGGTPT